MNDQEQVTFNQIPLPPKDAAFTLEKVERVTMPHPYCITPKHVQVAADECFGQLDAEAIRLAEQRGARCDICRVNNLRLSYDQHEALQTLFIRVPKVRDLNTILGLHAYLLSIKNEAERLGIQGFAFPPMQQEEQ